jgi:hypothetical protein
VLGTAPRHASRGERRFEVALRERVQMLVVVGDEEGVAV